MLEEILNTLSLTKWIKKKDIMKSLNLNISERMFRKLVEQNNRLFAQGKTDYYIAHSFRGYKKTFNWNEMKESIADNRKRAITMLVDCDRIEKAFQRRNQIKMEELENE